MVKRMWNFVDKFFRENELESYIVQNAVSMKRTEEIEAGKKVIYRCSKYRKYAECDFQVKVIFSGDGGITILTSNEHNHAYRASTTRAPSLVSEIVINSVAAGLSRIQMCRATEHQYKGVVSHSQLCNLLNYADRLITVPMMCSCRTNLKTYVCKHAVGASIHFGLHIISNLHKLKSLGKQRGRPKKTAGPALSR
ncbi:unnamed protein product [Rotaria sordida]|uniref:SWIM-type domain-containing protein n=1 Tax=Rotaria sordida TaxID=392033 RepID=A0A818X423_9BILA|nr:unnamed protein product [Rotaria sordida]CAF3733631.1 unnamed protein product [Rotaria sordida]